MNYLDCKFLKAFLLSALIAFCIELSRFVFCLGYADIDDFILNILGLVIGYITCQCGMLFYKLSVRSRSCLIKYILVGKKASSA